MSARLAAVVETIRVALDVADKLDPPQRDEIYRELVADLHARRPDSVSPLQLGPPVEPIRDPRCMPGGAR